MTGYYLPLAAWVKRAQTQAAHSKKMKFFKLALFRTKH
jgi:hypothetical protein